MTSFRAENIQDVALNKSDIGNAASAMIKELVPTTLGCLRRSGWCFATPTSLSRHLKRFTRGNQDCLRRFISSRLSAYPFLRSLEFFAAHEPTCLAHSYALQLLLFRCKKLVWNDLPSGFTRRLDKREFALAKTKRKTLKL